MRHRYSNFNITANFVGKNKTLGDKNENGR